MPLIPFQTWLTSSKGYLRLLEFDHAQFEEGIKKTVLFQLLGAEGMRQFGNEPAAARLVDNVYSFITFCDALESFFHKPVKPAWARLELHNHHQGMQESAAEFFASLRKLLPDCRFHAEHQLEHLAMQVLAGSHSDATRKCMLLEEQIDLDKFINILVSEESVVGDMAVFGAQVCADSTPSTNVQPVQSKVSRKKWQSGGRGTEKRRERGADR